MILLDTSFIISHYNTRDDNHARASEVMDDISSGKYGSAYITDYIFDETLTVALFKIKDLKWSVEIGKALRNSSEILKVDDFIFETAWDAFKGQKKPTFSFTDCTTLAILQKTGIQNLASFDDGFKKIKGINLIQA